MSKSIAVCPLKARPITVENFRPYGQLITPSNDGKMFNESDAQLNLNNGVPRFYIMRLQTRGRKFNRITRHSQCTQCLGSLGGKEWFLGVAPPNPNPQPDLEKLIVFRIPGDCFIKLEVGTWHAGPLFDQPAIDFYNLELSDTNIVDHFTYSFAQENSLEFEIVD
jgi:ureidoglycolate hydrolase